MWSSRAAHILVARKLRGEKKEWRENATLQVQILSDLPPPTIPPPEVSTAFEQLVKL